MTKFIKRKNSIKEEPPDREVASKASESFRRTLNNIRKNSNIKLVITCPAQHSQLIVRDIDILI